MVVKVVQARVPPLAMHAHEQRRRARRCMQPRAGAAAGARPPLRPALLCPQLHTRLGTYGTARQNLSSFEVAGAGARRLAACLQLALGSAATQCSPAGTHLQHVLRLLLHKAAQLCVVHLHAHPTPSTPRMFYTKEHLAAALDSAWLAVS